MTPPASSRALDVRWLGALFFVSGASGLVFEVLWVKLLGLWVGHTTLAMSLVVSAFLTGLLLGNLAVASRVDRARRPLRLYAVVEALTGVSALAVSLLLPRLSSGALGGAVTSSLVRVAVAFVLLLGPTMAMGASLPALTRAATRRLADAPAVFGSLYALNTLGAVLGCALAGFWSIGALGLTRSSIAAALCNLAVATIAWALDARAAPTEPAQTATEATPPQTPLAVHGRVLLACAFATGFASIACEVLWFRVLRSFVKSSTYAFTLLLVVFLTGLTLGGGWFSRRLAKHASPRALLSDLQSALGFLVLLSVALLGRSGSIARWLHDLGTTGVYGDGDLAQLALGALILLAPTAVMGATFPLIATLAADDMAGLGRRVAWVSAANTLGGALASMVTGLWVMPAMGAQRGVALSSALSAAVALAVADKGESRARATRIAVALAVAWALVPGDYLVRAVSTFGLGEVLEVREGRDGTATVVAYDRDAVCRRSPNHCAGRCTLDFHYRQLLFGTVSYASTIPPARRYMRALAHLPMLQRPGAGEVLQICFGTGTTAGAFTTHPTLRSLTIVDINPDVFGFARYFRESNLNALADPRVHPVIEDGRRYLSATTARFDVISLEPPPPTAEGAVSLYTREFYTLARRRLRAGGVLAQWIPLDQQSASLNRAMLASMRAEFASVWVYLPSRVEAVVLASDAPLRPDLAAWTARWDAPRVRENLADVGFPTPGALLATLVLDAAGTAAYVGDEAAMTDDLPRAEYYRSAQRAPFDLEAMLAHATDVEAMGAPHAWVTAERSQMRAHMRSLRGDDPGARVLANDARATVGATPYTDYLTALEYDCLNLDAP